MPWRKPWINPKDVADKGELRQALERRAYEVWISEIMLQQTRVAAVIDYWNKWMKKWPTIQDLAQANPDDVLAAWRGLGYYSRATRIHEAAKLVVNDAEMNGMLPSTAADLAAKIPGVGRYTAGAISCIAFGNPAPMVDGNVLRVLSRQLGIHGNIKTDKSVIDMIWIAAEALVEAVAKDSAGDDAETPADTGSDGPGRWGQGLMELGSTICTPKPNCAECPITDTCRAYNEGLALLDKPPKQAQISDMEDLCQVCEPFDYSDDAENNAVAPPAKKSGKQSTLAAFMFKKLPANGADNGDSRKGEDKRRGQSKADTDAIVNHARKFPIKVAKKAVREEETLVCAILRSDGRYLIHRRPPKGLLAGLWELPSYILEDPKATTSSERKKIAHEYVKSLFNMDDQHDLPGLEYIGDLGSIPWLFSHIKLTMHAHFFKLHSAAEKAMAGGESSRWTAKMEAESMGTGMRKCWDLVKCAAD